MFDPSGNSAQLGSPTPPAVTASPGWRPATTRSASGPALAGVTSRPSITTTRARWRPRMRCRSPLAAPRRGSTPRCIRPGRSPAPSPTRPPSCRYRVHASARLTPGTTWLRSRLPAAMEAIRSPDWPPTAIGSASRATGVSARRARRLRDAVLQQQGLVRGRRSCRGIFGRHHLGDRRRPAARGGTAPDKPAAPTPDQTLNRDGNHTVSWGAVTDADGDSIDHYVLQHERSDQNAFSDVANVSGSAYHFGSDGAAEAEGTWTYRVIAVDSHGTPSTPSDASSVVVVDKTKPNPPTGHTSPAAAYTDAGSGDHWYKDSVAVSDVLAALEFSSVGAQPPSDLGVRWQERVHRPARIDDRRHGGDLRRRLERRGERLRGDDQLGDGASVAGGRQRRQSRVHRRRHPQLLQLRLATRSSSRSSASATRRTAHHDGFGNHRLAVERADGTGRDGSSFTRSTAGFSATSDRVRLPTTWHFQFRLDARYASASGSGPVYDSQPRTSRSARTSPAARSSHQFQVLCLTRCYPVRLVATTSAGTRVGPDITFATRKAPVRPPVAGQVTTGSAAGLVLIQVNRSSCR